MMWIILNITIFLISLILFIASRRQGRQNKIYRNIVDKIEEIRTINRCGTEKLRDVTRDSIRQFSNLIKRIEATVNKTNEILNVMKDEVSLKIVKDTVGKDSDRNELQTRQEYESILQGLIEELSMITGQKLEELDKLSHIRAYTVAIMDEIRKFQIPDEARQKIQEKMDAISRSAESAAESLKTSANIESRFVYSTVLILKDVLLSLIDSVIRLNSIVDSTLGESSSIGDEINAIVVNLQCEDICQEISAQTLVISALILDDLEKLIPDYVQISRHNNEEKNDKFSSYELRNNDSTDDDVTFF